MSDAADATAIGGAAIDAAARYDERAVRHRDGRDRARRIAGRLSVARLLAVLAAVAGAAAGVGGTLPAAIAAASTAALLAVFATLAVAHGRAQAREQRCAVRAAVSERGARRVRRAWDALPLPAWPSTDVPLADDLDLLGRASLAQLLDVVTPAVGAPRLLAWLLADPPPADVIRRRQNAAAEVASRDDFLEACAAASLAARAVAPRTLDAFLAWADAGADGTIATSRPHDARATRAAAVVLATATLACAAFAAAGAPLGAALGALLIVNLVLAGLAHRALGRVLAGVGDAPALLGPALALLRRVDAEPLQTPAWSELRTRWRAGGGVAAMRRLERLLAWREVRYSPMLHWLLNAVVVYDAHVLGAFHAWRRGAGPAARGWFDALGDAEALVALATLAHDNPAWTWPVVTDEVAASPALDAHALAHPLLAADRRVGNAVRLDGPGALLVVSGSNMAGKTTLLRAVGLNVLLAQAGGPVCADAMRWRRLRVRTSVRVRDALGEGVSLYLAELRRLKAVVDDASVSTAPTADVPVLYLLDEILHGTNSADRRAATRAVLARLGAAGALGIITTHDLELADAPGLAPRTRHQHFRERYERGPDGPRMTFDYVARPGKAVGANALALLALLGLDAPAEARPAASRDDASHR